MIEPPFSTAPPPVDVELGFEIMGERFDLQLRLPGGPVARERMLPLYYALANELGDRGVAAAGQAGREISCKIGCGACCRQIVPISLAEARAIAALVDAMPEPRRSMVRARFDDAIARVVQSDAIDLLNDPDRSEEGTRALIVRYFKLGIPCPFLEDESCSIHLSRPTICREYLVTNPAEECAKADGMISRVPLPGSVSRALLRTAQEVGDTVPWVPLISALRIAEARPAPAPRQTAVEQLSAVIAALPDEP